jgi:predicted alpha/beta hydrolase family esterase
VDLGAAGHINTDSSLGDWHQGHTLLQTLLKD